MTLPNSIRQRLSLPVIAAPMFLVSSPALVIESCKAGLVGAFPRQNARDLADFETWLREIREQLDTWSSDTGRTPGPLAVNIPTQSETYVLAGELDLCLRYGVDIIITSVGKPTEITPMIHDRGMLAYHDATSMKFAEKAIAAGVDGLNVIGAGGGGHSGTLTHLAFIPKVRAIFDGTIALAGAVSTGAVVRAAEVLGADLAFMGTRFTATIESAADPRQKELIVAGSSVNLSYTARVNGLPANWMLDSLAERGIDLDLLPEPVGHSNDHLPDGVRPWRDLWSAGQGIELIDDIPSVAELVARLAREYIEACETPGYADAARALLHTAR